MKLKSLLMAALAAAFVFVCCDKDELQDPNKSDQTEQTDSDNPGGTEGTDPDNPGGTDPDNPDNPGGTDPEDPENPGGTDPDNPDNPGGTDPEDPENPGGTIQTVSLMEFRSLSVSDKVYRISGVIWDVDEDYVIIGDVPYNDDLDPETTGFAAVENLKDQGFKPGDVLTVVGKRGGDAEEPILVDAVYESHKDYDQPFLMVSMSAHPYLPSTNAAYDLEVYSNCNWSVALPEGVTANPTSGNGDAVVTFTFPDNTSTSDVFYPVTFTYNGKQLEYKFQQQANMSGPEEPEKPSPVLTLETTFAEVPADATYFEFVVTSNVAWTATASAGMTVTPASGYGEGDEVVTLSFAANTAYEPVTYEVTFSAEGVDSQTFTLTQAAAEKPAIQTVTVAEFLAASVGNAEYQLTGVMSGTYNTTYGNFYLEDETGKVLVYGLTATKQSSNDKSFASLGLRDGDTLTLIGKRADYNGTAQVGGPAYYVSHVAAPFVDFTASNASVDAEATTYTIEVQSNTNWTATPSTGVTLDKTSGNGNASVVMTFAANTTSEAISHSVVFTAEGSTATFELLHKGVPAATGGGRADLETLSTNTSYVSSTTTDGWKGANCAIVQGGTSDSSPTFKCIGKVGNTSTYAKALCMNGKTSAVGTITSPTLKGGCGTLSFDYTLVFSDTKVKFRVDILQGGSVVKAFTVDHSSFTKFDVKTATYDVNVAGDFTVKFTNLSPSSSTSNKDRTAVWNIEWTGYSN